MKRNVKTSVKFSAEKKSVLNLTANAGYKMKFKRYSSKNNNKTISNRAKKN